MIKVTSAFTVFDNKQKVSVLKVYSLSGSFPKYQKIVTFKVPKISWQ